MFGQLPEAIADKIIAERFKKDVEYLRSDAEISKNTALQEIANEENELDYSEYLHMRGHFRAQRRSIVDVYERKAALYNRMLIPLRERGLF